MQELGMPGWNKVCDYVPGLNYTVRGLDEGKQYAFRVRAENMVGQSEPLLGVPVTAKDQFGTRLVLTISIYHR